MAQETPKNIDFDEVSQIINSKFELHKRNIEECCVKSSIIPLADYYEALEKEYKKIESQIEPSTVKPDPLEFLELFKTFDEYPANLQKPTKQPIKENTRMNATIKVTKQNNSSTSLNSSKSLSDQPSAALIYKEFCKYTEKLSKFKEELRQQTSSREYSEKLDSINTFARELDKLLQCDDVGSYAFTKEEEEKIRSISECMEHFVYIQESQDLYSTADASDSTTARLNDLVDIVTDALFAVNCYKPC